jgi:hypothetical protein
MTDAAASAARRGGPRLLVANVHDDESTMPVMLSRAPDEVRRDVCHDRGAGIG